MFLRSGGDVGGHAESDGEAHGRAEHGVGDAGVAGGGVEEGFAGERELALALGVGDDGGGGAVFDAAAGVGPLGFAEDLDAGQCARQAVETQQRRVADAVEKGEAERFGGCGDHGDQIVSG